MARRKLCLLVVQTNNPALHRKVDKTGLYTEITSGKSVPVCSLLGSVVTEETIVCRVQDIPIGVRKVLEVHEYAFVLSLIHI